MPNSGFAAKRVYPSEQGLHIECYTEAEAQAAYEDAKNRGINNVEVDGCVYTWKFYNPRSLHPIPISHEHRHRISRGRSRLHRLRQLPKKGLHHWASWIARSGWSQTPPPFSGEPRLETIKSGKAAETLVALERGEFPPLTSNPMSIVSALRSSNVL